MTINKSILKYLFLLLPLLSSYSCSKRSEIGLGLSQDGSTILEVINDLPMAFSVENGDTLLTSNNSLVRRFCGHHVHPVFGTTDGGLFMNFKLSRGRPNFTGVTIDSIVLKLFYDEGGQENIGDLSQIQTWEVLRVSEDINDGENYYSNKAFTTSDVLNPGFAFTPSPRTRIITVDTSGLDTARAHIRIPLSTVLAAELVDPDTAKFQTSDAFQDFFKGLFVRPKSGSNNNSLIGIDYLYNPPVISVYYTKNGIKYRYDFNKGSGTASVAQYAHDYTGTNVLSNALTDENAYIHGTGGARIKVKFPTAQALDEIIVNKAVLTLSVVSPSFTDEQYPLPDQLIISYRNNEGKLVVIEDVSSIIIMGGRPRTVQVEGGRGTELVYEINLSGHFQRIVDETIDSDEIVISIYSPSENGELLTVGNERSLLNAPKFSLTYTKFPQ